MFRYRNYMFLFLLLCGLVANAQKNIVKTGLTGAFLGDIKLAFESAITPNSSMLFNIGYLDPTLSPLIPDKAFTPKAYNLLESNGGISFSAEYRFYISNKGRMQGFYLAPYLRYFNQSMLFDDEIANYLFTVDTKLSTFGTGIQLGYQWIFSDLFTFDFFFFGTGIDFHKGVIIYELEPEPPNFNYAIVTPILDDILEDIRFLNNKPEHEVNADNHTTRLPFLFPGIRMGISVGVAF